MSAGLVRPTVEAVVTTLHGAMLKQNAQRDLTVLKAHSSHTNAQLVLTVQIQKVRCQRTMMLTTLAALHVPKVHTVIIME
jgi:hypothetical protein